MSETLQYDDIALQVLDQWDEDRLFGNSTFYLERIYKARYPNKNADNLSRHIKQNILRQVENSDYFTLKYSCDSAVYDINDAGKERLKKIGYRIVPKAKAGS